MRKRSARSRPSASYASSSSARGGKSECLHLRTLSALTSSHLPWPIGTLSERPGARGGAQAKPTPAKGETNHVGDGCGSPGGVRLGTPALTTRGLAADDFDEVADQLHAAVQIALRIQTASGPKLKDFVALLHDDPDVAALRERVTAFARRFPMPGD